ncbi:MAG: MerC domain-containing protein [Lysobacterales bacterium]|nr:MerC domain-containing protein [Rhodanobacteraceae bacterium]
MSMPQHPKHRGSVSLDGLGAGVSLACAVHCAAIPLIFGLIPSMQLALQSWDSEWQTLARWLLWTHDAERVFVSLVLVFASTVLIRGYLKHRQSAPLLIGAIAALGLIGGAFGHWHSADLLHVALQVGGGLALAAAHIVNLRCLRRAGLHAHKRDNRVFATAAAR